MKNKTSNTPKKLQPKRSIHKIKRASAIASLQSPKKANGNILNLILPKSGFKCVAELISTNGDRILRHIWFKRKKYAVDFVKTYKNKTNQLFVAQASFKEKGTEWKGRTQANAAFLKNFFMDIDCGKGKNGIPKPYASQEEGNKALLSFCHRAGLPIPTIVNSGNGLYAHWMLTNEIDSQTWIEVAHKLKKLVFALEPGLDNDKIIADTARILRPVGSTHRKDPRNPKMVTLLRDSDPLDFQTFTALVDKALTSLSSTSSTTPDIELIPSSTGDTESKSSRAVLIAEKCPVIGHIKETKGNVSEPLWYAAIGVLRHCVESPGVIHEWSSGYPGYSIEETDSKIAQHNMPPTTCGLFSEHCPELCKSCEHNGKIKSPISLGFISTSLDTIPEFVSELNLEHFVSRTGGRTVVCREVFDSELKRNKLEMSSFSDFTKYYNNQKITIGSNRDGNPITVQLGKAWLEHPKRRQYKDIKLTPEGDIEGVYNLWRGFQVIPAKGSWKLMKNHIQQVICDSDKRLYKYVIRWLARLVQKPWTQGEVALVLQGKKGIGKGKFVNALCQIMGRNSMSIYNGKHLTGNFNAHLEDCILLYVDEAFWAGDKGGEGVLKGLITEPTIPIERKGYDLKSVRNLLHIIIASNNDWVVPASMDERRYCVLKVSERHINDFPYFAAIDNELRNGGLEAMLYYLQNLDISNFNVRDMPKTEALTEQKIQSLDTVMSWWLQKLKDGDLLPGYGWGVVPVPALYDDYVSSVQKQGSSIRRVTDTAFAMQLRKVMPKKWPKKRRQSSRNEPRRVNHYEFPKLDECRRHFEEYLGVDSLDWY